MNSFWLLLFIVKMYSRIIIFKIGLHKERSKNLPPLCPFNTLRPLENRLITKSLSLSSVHRTELESHRLKPIVDCITEDKEAKSDW